MPIGTPFHPRTSALCESMSWRDWAGYFAVSSYEVHLEHEYNAIRQAAALIDVSPLFKYRLTGRDAGRLIDRAGQSLVQGLDEVLKPFESFRYRFWKPSLVQLARKAKDYRAR